MSKKSWAIVLFALTPILFVFQNCGSSFHRDDSSVSFSYCKLQPHQQSPFVSSKVRIKKQFFNKSSFGMQKLTNTNREELSLVVDVSCLEQQAQPSQFLDQDIHLSSKQKSLRKTAVTLSITGQPTLEALEAEIDNNPCFLGVAENLKMKRTQTSASALLNDPQVSEQKHIDFVGYSESRDLQQTITEKVVVAFIDSGVDYNHPDLSSRMWKDSNGKFGYNFISDTTDPMDDDGHGTHVAGLVAAVENNSYGVAGLTGDYLQIMAIKVLDNQGAGSSQNVYNGIQFAIQNGADIINLSVESPGQNTLMEDAINDANQAGIIVTAATGNQADEIRADNLYAPAYIAPSLGGVISVASVDTQNAALSVFSNYSSTYAEIAAPGAQVSTSSSGGLLSTAPNSSWRRIRGTSQATPIVTAAAAILIGYLKTKKVDYTPTGIENFLKSDGSAYKPDLSPYISGGHLIQIGFLSRNLNIYFSSEKTSNDNMFSGDETTGNTCVIK